MRIYRRSQRYFGVEQLDQRLRRGLVGYWKFNEGSGLTAQDLSGKRNHGTLINGPKWSLGREHIGNALSFDGVDDYVDIPSITTSSIITFEAWFKRISLGVSYPRLHSRGASPWSLEFGINDNIDKLSYFLAFTDDTTTGWQEIYTVTNEIWYHTAITWDGTWVRLYVNGGEVHSSNAWAGKTLNQGPSNIGGPNYFNGIIDEVRIYNRALSAEEIKAHSLGARVPILRQL